MIKEISNGWSKGILQITTICPRLTQLVKDWEFVFSASTSFLSQRNSRNLTVANGVFSISQYRNNFKLEKHKGCPSEVVAFAEERCLQFTPHDVFVMDVCESSVLKSKKA
jgi:hypothetical protein